MLYNLQQETGGPTLKQIAIPTTLSAAEYTVRLTVGTWRWQRYLTWIDNHQSAAGYTDEEGHKVGVSSHELAPAGVILDAELTLATPERLW